MNKRSKFAVPITSIFLLLLLFIVLLLLIIFFQKPPSNEPSVSTYPHIYRESPYNSNKTYFGLSQLPYHLSEPLNYATSNSIVSVYSFEQEFTVWNCRFKCTCILDEERRMALKHIVYHSIIALVMASAAYFPLDYIRKRPLRGVCKKMIPEDMDDHIRTWHPEYKSAEELEEERPKFYEYFSSDDCVQIQESVEECVKEEEEEKEWWKQKKGNWLCKGDCKNHPENAKKIDENAPENFLCENLGIKVVIKEREEEQEVLNDFEKQIETFCYVESLFNYDKDTSIYEGNYCVYDPETIKCKKYRPLGLYVNPEFDLDPDYH